MLIFTYFIFIVTLVNSNNHNIEIVFENFSKTAIVVLSNNCNNFKSIDLITKNNEKAYLTCNSCNSGLYINTNNSNIFYEFTNPNDCEFYFNTLRTNIDNLKISSLELTNNKISSISTLSDLNFYSLINYKENFNKDSFTAIASNIENLLININNDKLRLNLISLSLYIANLEEKLASCFTTHNCSNELLEEAKTFKNWHNLFSNQIESISYQIDFKMFNNNDFFSYINNTSTYNLNDLDRIENDSKNWSSITSKVNEDFREFQIEQSNNNPINRSNTAKDILSTCRSYNLNSYPEAQKDLQNLLHFLSIDKTDPNNPELNKILHYNNPINVNPVREYNQLQATCMELSTITEKKLIETEKEIDKLYSELDLISQALNKRMNLLNGICKQSHQAYKIIVDKFNSEKEIEINKRTKEFEENKVTLRGNYAQHYASRTSSYGEREARKDPNEYRKKILREDIRNIEDYYKKAITKEVNKYIEGEGIYADPKNHNDFPPFEFAKLAYFLLFDDILKENTLIYSPVSTFSVSKHFRKLTNFKNLGSNFIHECLVNDNFFESKYDNNELTEKTYLSTEDIKKSIDGVKEKIKGTISFINKDKEICSKKFNLSVSDGETGTYLYNADNRPSLDAKTKKGLEEVFINQEKENLENFNNLKEHSIELKKIISKYIRYAPNFVLSYIYEGKDKLSNISVMCGAILAYHKELKEIDELVKTLNIATTVGFLGTFWTGPVAIVSGVFAFSMIVIDSKISINKIFEYNKDKKILNASVIAGADAVDAQEARRYLTALNTSQYTNLTLNALFLSMIGKSTYLSIKNLRPPLDKLSAPTLNPEPIYIPNSFSKYWNSTSKGPKFEYIKYLNKRLLEKTIYWKDLFTSWFGSRTGTFLSNGVKSFIKSTHGISKSLKMMQECVKYSTTQRKLVIKNLVGVSEGVAANGQLRLFYDFKVGDQVYKMSQKVNPADLKVLKAKYGSDLTKWASNGNLPNLSKVVSEQLKYSNPAAVTGISEFFIRNASTQIGYVTNLNGASYELWAVAPDNIATTLKAAVPYIGISQMSNKTSQYILGTNAGGSFSSEKIAAATSAYLPSLEFTSKVELFSNNIYRISGSAISTHGAEFENAVTSARYASAMLWTAFGGLPTKFFIWDFIQGTMCLIPQMKILASLKTGSLRALQFIPATVFQLGYSSVTSHIFFWLRNTTLHKLDLYSNQEKLENLEDHFIPIEAVIDGPINFAPLSKEMFEDQEFYISEELEARINKDYDAQIELEFEWIDIE